MGSKQAWTELRSIVSSTPPVGPYTPARNDDAVSRYLDHAVRPGTPLAPAALLEMRGRLKLDRWLPFRARQLLAPRYGTVWTARVGGVVFGSDRYVAGIGGMDWRLMGLIPIVRARGADIARSAAGRAAGESIWVPTALAAPGSARWSATGDGQVSVDIETDGHPVTLHHQIDPATGALRSSTFQRWGDPDETGSWGPHAFGVEVAAERTFGDITIPSEGHAGWHHGTDRWEAGRFFQFEITKYDLIAPGSETS